MRHQGQLAPEGSTATAYSWLVWLDGEVGTALEWIGPCRKRLERAADYEAGFLDWKDAGR